jgi:transposase-like protein
MNQRYDATFTAQAMELVSQKTRPASVIAAELGVPRKTLYR